jgi:glycosyltransferase involved in cell wall biosynthesis
MGAHHPDSRCILVAGYPYVRERYFATFRYWPPTGEVEFLLPRRWTAKGGSVVFDPPQDANVTHTAALFHHSDTPLIGGLLKGWMPAFPIRLWRVRKDVRLVYACSEPTLLTTLWFAVFSRLLGKKFVCFTWENIPYRQKYGLHSFIVHRFLIAINLLLSNGIVCGNREGEAIYRVLTDKPIAVIAMNGVDPETFTRRHERLPQLSGRTVYAFVGAIGYRKGIHVAISALERVLPQVPDAHLIIAGAGEYDREIDRLIDELDLRAHVTRLPWVDQEELLRLLSGSDIFLYPSIPSRGWAEQFGYSMAEASLMELPVISTRSGSIADLVVDGETGILVPPGDVEALAGAMVRLGTDARLRERLGRNGREYVAERFSHAAVARQFYDFLTSL